MCEPLSIVAGGMALVGGAMKVVGDIKAGDAAEATAQANKLQADQAAADALARGEQEANVVQMKANQIVGKQRVGYAAGNVDVASGSALQTQLDTATMAKVDEDTLRNNAEREAHGYKMQGINFLREGANAKSAATVAAVGDAFGAAASATSIIGGSILRGKQGPAVPITNTTGKA